MRKFGIIVAALLAILVIILVIRFISGEDNWICENGKWVKHGAPSSQMPSKLCK